MVRKNPNTRNKSKNERFIDTLLEKYSLDMESMKFEEGSDSEKMYSSIQNEMHEKKVFFTISLDFSQFTNFILKPALAIMVIVLVSSIWFYKPYSEKYYAEIIVEKGEKINLHLNDEVSVWLNENSRLKFPTHNRKNRKIFLEGEAYFQIQDGARNNYSVEAGELICHVEGTKFNVKARHEDPITEVSVVEGSVRFASKEIPGRINFIAEAGEKTSYHKKGLLLTKEEEVNENLLAWHSNELKFTNKELWEVTETVSKYFAIPIEIQNEEIEEININESFKRARLDDVLDVLKLNYGCSITADGEKLIIN